MVCKKRLYMFKILSRSYKVKKEFDMPQKRAIKSNSSLKKAIARIENEYNLPEGCVKLVKKNGRKMRDDATVQTLRLHWEQ